MGGGPASSSAPQLLATRQPLLSSVSCCGSVHPCHLQTCVVSMVCRMLRGRPHPLLSLCYFVEESGLAGMWLQDLFVRLD